LATGCIPIWLFFKSKKEFTKNVFIDKIKLTEEQKIVLTNIRLTKNFSKELL